MGFFTSLMSRLSSQFGSRKIEFQIRESETTDSVNIKYNLYPNREVKKGTPWKQWEFHYVDFTQKFANGVESFYFSSSVLSSVTLNVTYFRFR